MVARTPPPKIKKIVAPLNPILLRETVNKVDKCMARLQELQHTVTGGGKGMYGVRCKQQSTRVKNYTPRKSPTGKLTKITGEWQRMSLPAMLLGETVGEILQASQFAKEIWAAVAPISNTTIANNDPKTPISVRQNQRPNSKNSELQARRMREKQPALQPIRPDSSAPRLHRAKSRINFKVSPPRKTESDKENRHHTANRMSPRNKPWPKKTVIFPNISPTMTQLKFNNTKSPVMAKNHRTPHKFLVKSPASASKYQVKIKSPSVCVSPTRPLSLSRKSPKVSTAAKLRRSFSPSRLASKLVSPLKSRRKSFVHKSDGMKIMMSGLKQRPQVSTPLKFLAQRI